MKHPDKWLLCESDYRFILIVWAHEPIRSGALIPLCKEKLGWTKSTTYTILRKLCERGLLQNVNSVVTSVIPKEQVQADTSAHFIDHTFEGSLPKFIASFLSTKPLSEEEVAEIRAMIDKYE